MKLFVPNLTDLILEFKDLVLYFSGIGRFLICSQDILFSYWTVRNSQSEKFLYKIKIAGPILKRLSVRGSDASLKSANFEKIFFKI